LDIKSKRNYKIGIVIMILAVLLPAIGTVAMYPVFEDRAAESEHMPKQGFINYGVLDSLMRGSFVLYMEAREAKDEQKYSPSDVFLASDYGGSEIQYAPDEMAYELPSRQELEVNVNETIYSWKIFFEDTRKSLEYSVYDSSGKLMITNAENSSLKSFINGSNIAESNEDYATVIVMNYDSLGKLRADRYYGDSSDSAVSTLEQFNRENPLAIESYGELVLTAIAQPSDVTIVYAIPKDSALLTSADDWNVYLSYSESGFLLWYIVLIMVIAVIAFILPLIKPLHLGNVKLFKIPLEIAIILISSVLSLYDSMLGMVIDSNGGVFLTSLSTLISSQTASAVVATIVNGIIWTIVLSLCYLAAASLHAVVTLGFKNYLRERSWTWRFFRWVKRKIKAFFQALAEIDLEEQTNKQIFKIVFVNFVILTILCMMWVFGIVGVVIYSIALYFLLKKYAGLVKTQYEKLLKVTNAMAEGDLDVSIDEDLGLFNAFKKELQKIQKGFKKAVEKEVASQNMRTELITNVSHDLKTPLTAIITYVNLLKNEDITDEERNSYIETIDNKSMRLKALIEDLFEVSKADSKNVNLNLVPVDLIDLIKQVYYESEDKVAEANLEFRLNLPDQKVILILDSQKTYRIFENLLTNCIKYALKGTRVYIDFTENDEEAAVVFKNISASELNFPPDKLTERFIRGDLARNTDGSGLGLAIAKSFIELQGGRLDIKIDGDLFKVVARFKKKA